MIPVILGKRISKASHRQAFNLIIKYVTAKIRLEKLSAISIDQKFTDILNYTTGNQDRHNNKEKCIAIRTNQVADILSATTEMNVVSMRNSRCKDPVFHFVLTWAEHERPHPDLIFEAAEYVIKSLGLSEHQYVLAIHTNTDNIHCHCAVNRIHPYTYKSKNIEWAKKTIHLAARQCEIKHGWTNDNGIYIVKTDGQNNKTIVLNPEHDHTIKRSPSNDKIMSDIPVWHDPESLESWLKYKIAKALKNALAKISNWHELHVWLAQYDITLSDTGGGGMRLHVTSLETGEVVDLPASKGLRILKRSELEKRWGKFENDIPTRCVVPDLSHLTHSQIADGVNCVLTMSFDKGIPPQHIIVRNENRRKQGLGIPSEFGADEIFTRKSLTRDNAKRVDLREQRAVARANLRLRFSQYQRSVREGDVDYIERTMEIRAERHQSLKTISDETKAAKSAVKRTRPIDFIDRVRQMAEINFEKTHRRLKTEAVFQEKNTSLRATRLPSLGWREWLYEQSNLGDQSAISALRGIVYQAQRDAKRGSKNTHDSLTAATDTKEYREQLYREVISRLLLEERNEVAIRSAQSNAMRPCEVDSLLVRYIGLIWRITGNGNITYHDQTGEHLFTDRGTHGHNGAESMSSDG